MSPNRPYTASGKHLVPGVLLAVLLGLAAPVYTVLEAALLRQVIVVSGVLMVFLYLWAGRLSAWLFMTVQLCAAAALGSGPMMLMLMAAGSLPAMFTVRLIAQRRPFPETLRGSAAAYLLGMTAALAVAWTAFGGGLIGQAVDAAQAQLAQMPDAYFTALAGNLNAALTGSRAMTASDVRQQMSVVLAQARQLYGTALPGQLIAGAAASGVLSALWGCWLLARQGMATNESYLPLTRCFLPPEVSTGLMLMWLTTFLMEAAGYPSGAAVQEAAFELLSLAFCIQALAAIDRFFFRQGMPDRNRRTLVLTAAALGRLILMARGMLFILGLGSAMFGAHGAFKNRFNKQ